MTPSSLPLRLLLGLVVGGFIGIGWPSLGAQLRPLGALYGEALLIPIVPVVFFGITAGIFRAITLTHGAGRIGIICATAIALLSAAGIGIGLGVASMFHLTAEVAVSGASSAIAAVDWIDFISRAIPSNLAAAAADRQMLAIAVGGALFGAALAVIGQSAEAVIAGLDIVMAALFRVTLWIVSLAPIAVVGVIAALVAAQDWAIVGALARFIAIVYLGLAILVGLLCAILYAVGERPWTVIRSVAAPLALAFATRSSMSVMPLHMERLRAAGMPNSVVGTALPLAHIFNRAAASLFIVMAVIFISGVRGHDVDGATLATIGATTFALSLGAASLPSGSLLIVAAVLTEIGISAGDVAIIAGIDAFTDTGRTAVNLFAKTTIAKVVQFFSRGHAVGSEQPHDN